MSAAAAAAEGVVGHPSSPFFKNLHTHTYTPRSHTHSHSCFSVHLPPARPLVHLLKPSPWPAVRKRTSFLRVLKLMLRLRLRSLLSTPPGNLRSLQASPVYMFTERLPPGPPSVGLWVPPPRQLLHPLCHFRDPKLRNAVVTTYPRMMLKYV